jgi:hypothetical protein
MKLINNYLFLLVSILVFNNSFSQEIEIPNVLITDRPDATEASSTVGKGTLQIETGAFYDSFTNNNVNFKNYTINTTLIRYGILENLELRIGWDFVEGITTENNLKLNNITSGLSPLLLGVKIDVSKENARNCVHWPYFSFI